MRLSALVQAIAADLEGLGSLGDESTAEAARRLATAMEGPLTARLIEGLSQVAAELDVSVAGGHVEVRLLGGDADLVWVSDAETEVGERGDDEADASARITLRLSAQLKARIEAASSQDGVSVNTWIVRALGQATRPRRGPRVGRSLTGYGRS